jgi:hypothetical protein
LLCHAASIAQRQGNWISRHGSGGARRRSSL